ncbi:MAG: DUF2059 domain-containing protein [Pseudomonadota bacterium]|nr:DUF2059 domain-containing protein [Pseudomonadota bacterium]
MRSVWLKALAIAVASAAPLPAFAQTDDLPAESVEPSAANLVLARQIVDLGFPEDTREALFFGAMDQMMIQTREASLKAYQLEDPEMVAILDAWIADYIEDSKVVLRSHIPTLIDAMSKSYAVMFTRKELEDILAFVSTPSGQRFFELSSAVLAEPNFAAANQAYMNETQALLPGAMKDLVDRLQEHVRSKKSEETGSTTS